MRSANANSYAALAMQLLGMAASVAAGGGGGAGLAGLAGLKTFGGTSPFSLEFEFSRSRLT